MKILKISDVWKEKYGEKIYKISLSTGCSCPNRDGTKSIGGCTFCSLEGSGEFAQPSDKQIATQIEDGIKKVRQKGAKKFVAYFQPFSNTYSSVDYLEPLFMSAIENPKIVELSIATRCDCLPNDILNMLDRLNKIKPVNVELGLQSIHSNTLSKTNCHYTIKDYILALDKLKSIGISVVTHIIIGFPWETYEQMIETARFVGESGTDGIKIHMLQVLRNTTLGREYLENPFNLFNLDEYAFILGECLKNIPEYVIIHRLTGDGAKKDLIAPLWSADKKKVLNKLNSYIQKL